MVGSEYEQRGIIKNGAKLLVAVSGVAVSKFTVICNHSHGAGTFAMAGRAFDPRFLFTPAAGSDFSHGCRSGDASAYGCQGKATGGRW
ncbi:hypothetical protein PYH38_006204 (plasmid) [Sinorhizobium numidicum]|uniref:Acetyl-coenzyme A carboxylase carboxyl transferase subunit beta domain-containing protein n=1 Tax=Sinorhizobium numidicum TaxID=680248 RepID=A0ABY8D4C1_9HYPH|nr:carboxyl transferase domain-containing protein [Sinorhizobium numidicum]WEX85710.1 hypothetical protein PYH38_006204 [Sinorhizobium numidicum]